MTQCLDAQAVSTKAAGLLNEKIYCKSSNDESEDLLMTSCNGADMGVIGNFSDLNFVQIEGDDTDDDDDDGDIEGDDVIKTEKVRLFISFYCVI